MTARLEIERRPLGASGSRRRDRARVRQLLAPAAALAGRAPGDRVVCVVSGGNIDLSTLGPILEGRMP